jgi:hypothetical protein
MEKNAKGLLPKVEIIIVGVFVFSFLIWIIPKCGSDRPDKKSDSSALLLGDTLQADGMPTDASKTPPTRDSVATSVPAATTATAPPPTAASPAAAKPEMQYSRLYVTIEGLNLRSEPGLKSKVLAKIPLFEEVFFLNEVTDSTTEISLGYEKANEPWVKIRTRKGQEGWVYGAGVSYYKKKRAGALE